MPSSFVITCLPQLLKCALRELRAVDPGLRVEQTLGHGAFRVSSEMVPERFTARLVEADPVFVRHVMPVNAEVRLERRRRDDLPRLLDQAMRIARVAPGERFSVQCRRVGFGYEYDAKDVEVCIGSAIERAGGLPTFSDTSAPDDNLKVVSVYLHRDNGYLGFSTVKENLNAFSDEYRGYARTQRPVCRAELKLVEAIRTFRIQFPHGHALDLGAAPGGWARVLAGHGLSVTAVDPAALHPDILRMSSVVHVRTPVARFTPDRQFDVLSNDMNTAPAQSAAQMLRLAPYVRPGSPVVMTVKFLTRQPEDLLKQTIDSLSPAYEQLRARNLFHNRFEVTLAGRVKREV